MAGNDALIAILGIGALGLGAMFLVPKVMAMGKNGNGNGNGYGYLEDVFPEGTKIQDGGGPLIPSSSSDIYEEEMPMPPRTRIIRRGFPYGREDEEDVYLITDEDFSKLDISKRERRWLDEERRLRDARLSRVLYGDNAQDRPMIPTFSGYVNTVNPYGQGPAKEFQRIGWSEAQSRINTRSNTLNLY